MNRKARRQQRKLAEQQAEANRQAAAERNRIAADDLADIARQRLAMQQRNFGLMSLVSRGTLRGFR